MEVAQTLFIHPFSRNNLICISNGLMATEDVRKDLISEKQKGKQAMEEFVDKHLGEGPQSEFFTPIKMKLKTFSTLKKIAKKRVNNKIIPIKSHSNMFGQLALIMQTRHVDFKKVLEYPVAPYPWSLCGSMGELRKTSKASLLHALEKDFTSDDNFAGETVTVLDGMALVQKTRTTRETFGVISDILLRTVLFLGKDSKRIDLVFDE